MSDSGGGAGCFSIFGLISAMIFGVFSFWGFRQEGAIRPPEPQPVVSVSSASTTIMIELSPAVDTPSQTLASAFDVVEQRLLNFTEAGQLNFHQIKLSEDGRIILEIVEGDSSYDEILPALTNIGLLEFVDVSSLPSEDLQNLTNSTLSTTAFGTRPNADPTRYPTILTNDDVAQANAYLDDFGNWTVAITFTPEGAATMREFSAANIGNGLAITLDGTVLIAPTIQSQIESDVIITGQLSENQAHNLAAQIKTPPLPVQLQIDRIDTSQ